MWSQLVQYQIFYKKKAFSKKSFRFGHSSSFCLNQNGHYGHLGVAEVSENGPNEFPMAQNLGIDTKIKSLACSEPKFLIWPF